MNEKKSEKEPVRKLYKSRNDKVIDGVCGGLAEYLCVDSTLIRILWLLSILLHGLGLIAYLLAVILVPVNPEHQNPKDKKEKKKKGSGNGILLWGIVLIVLGLIFLSQQLGWHYRWCTPFQYFHFWKISWKTIWPLGLILLGVLYIIHIFRSDGKDKRTQSKTTAKRLFRRSDKKMIAGVCAGIGQYLNVDVTLIRIAFVVMALATDVFVWIILYLALIIILPQETGLQPNEKK